MSGLVDNNIRAILVITSEKEMLPAFLMMEGNGMVSGEETKKTDLDLTWQLMKK